jgi:hypothetical protein
VLQEEGESIERALFERRARVHAAQAVAAVPSLDAVLRAARVSPREAPAEGSVETSSARRRAWGLALAAACLLTVMKARPSEATHPGIVADLRAEAPLAAGPVAGVCQEPEVAACAAETTCAADPMAPAPAAAPAVHDAPCTSPPVTLASRTTCDPDDGPTDIR